MNLFPYPQELSEYDIQKLDRYTEEDCVKAIRILKARLKMLRSQDFRLLQHVHDLNLSTRAKHVLLGNELYTVKDVLIYGIDRIALLRNAGANTVKEIKDEIERCQQQSLGS